MELVNRLLEGEKGVELLARHVEVEVCRLEEGKGTTDIRKRPELVPGLLLWL